MGNIIDVLVLLLFVISFFVMAKKGFVKAVYSISGHILTLILVAVLLTPTTDMLNTTKLGDIVSENVSKIVLQEGNEKSQEIKDEAKQESSLAPAIEKNLLASGIENATQRAVPYVTGIIMKILTAILLFIAIRIVVALVFALLDTFFKIPVLSQLNTIAGGIAGIINSLIIIYVICGILSLNFEWTNDLRAFVDQTRVLKYFYINNLLINIFI